MEATSPVLLLKLLDCLSVRSRVIAENIANAGTPHYRPLRIKFEDALKAAAPAGDAAVAAVQPVIERGPARPGGTELRLDLELASAASTSGRYGTVVELLNRQLQLDELAISVGHNT